MTRTLAQRLPLLVALYAAFAGSAAFAAPPPGWFGGGPGWWHISPKQTFYRTSNDPQAEDAIFFILGELPFANPSVPLNIHIYGDYKRTAAAGDAEKVLHGVFTKTPTIQVATLQKRLPDAVMAPSSFVASGPTYHNALATDIPEDFRVVPNANGDFKIQVPANAQWIALCVPDSYYSDNSDPDDDFYILFSRQ